MRGRLQGDVACILKYFNLDVLGYAAPMGTNKGLCKASG